MRQLDIYQSIYQINPMLWSNDIWYVEYFFLPNTTKHHHSLTMSFGDIYSIKTPGQLSHNIEPKSTLDVPYRQCQFKCHQSTEGMSLDCHFISSSSL